MRSWLAYEYNVDVRRYCEDLLKIMLRAEEPTVCDMTIGDLAKLLKERRDASVAPFSHVAFDKLYKTLSGGGGKQMKSINESHHVFDGTIGLAEAGDVKIFWETTLQNQIHIRASRCTPSMKLTRGSRACFLGWTMSFPSPTEMQQISGK